MRPKVCMLSTNFNYTGNPVFDLAKELAQFADIEIVVPHRPRAPKHERIGGVSVHRFQYAFPSGLQTLAYGSGIFENWKRSALCKAQLPLFIASFLAKTLSVAQGCDLIHAHWGLSGFVGVFAKKICRKPMVLTLHGDDVRKMPRWLSRFVIENADAVTTSHPDLMDEAKRIAPRQKRFLEIRNMADYRRFESASEADAELFRKEFGLKKEAVVTYIARLAGWKNPLMFVRAVPHVIKKRSGVRFFVVGDGTLRKDVEGAVKELRVGNWVHVLGRRLDTDAILKASDVFCALSTLENIFSVTIIEAALAGVPCIVTDVGYTCRYFRQGENAFVVPSGNEKKLADAILRLLDDEKARKALAKRAKESLAEWGFSRDVVAEKTMELYSSLVGQRKP